MTCRQIVGRHHSQKQGALFEGALSLIVLEGTGKRDCAFPVGRGGPRSVARGGLIAHATGEEEQQDRAGKKEGLAKERHGLS